MEKALVTAGFVLIPGILFALGFRLAGRKVDWKALLWAGIACLAYFSLLRSGTYVPKPAFLEGLTLTWVGKALSLAGTIAMLYVLPRVGFRAAGLTWAQNKGSLRPVLIAGAITLVLAAGSSIAFGSSPDTRLENLLFQATMPGLDEELFFRGLLLLLVHRAFGKDLRLWNADTGWGLWLVVAIFGLGHGFTFADGEIAVHVGAIIFTGYVGLILTWTRERTGSLVAPVLFHNIFNITMAFV